MRTLTLAWARACEWPRRLLGRPGAREGGHVLTAVMLSPAPALVRVQAQLPAAGTGPVTWQLLAARRDAPGAPPLVALKRWRSEGLLPRQGTVLVLGGADQQVQILDRPAVPDGELALAARWPLAETMEAEPEDLLVTATPLKTVNDSGRQQVLAVAARVAVAKAQLGWLAQAGVQTRQIDATVSALRGLALVHARPDSGTIVLFSLANELAVGLLWQGELCALRSLALPALADRGNGVWVEQLALQVQRTVDHYERQATQLAVREVLACLPELNPDERRVLCSAVALPTREVRGLAATPPAAPEGTGDPAPADATSEALAALACVGVVRLAAQLAQRPAPQGVRTAPTAQAQAQAQAQPPARQDAPAAPEPLDTPAQAAARLLAKAAEPAAEPAAGAPRASGTVPEAARPMEWTP